MNKARILVVEDEGIVAADISERLAALGYDVIGTAATSAEAQTKAASGKPDLVLMDIQLQGAEDGIETAVKIRQQLRIPVVYLTANSDPKTFERAKITRPFGYLLKPFDEALLQVNIEVALYNHAQDQERERLLKELQDAMLEIKRLQGLLPICAACKKIRDESGQWQILETYITRRSSVRFTHSYCPECAKKMEEQFEQLKIENPN